MTDSHAKILSFREIQYAAKAHRQANLLSHALYFGGIVIILLGIAFELFMLFDARRLDGQVIGASLIVCLIVLLGMMLIKISRDCKCLLHKERTLVQGWLEKTTISNPSGPDATFFHINNCQLILPPDGDYFCIPNVGLYAEVSGVVMTRESTRPSMLTKGTSLFKSSRKFDIDGPKLIVLNYHDYIDIDGVLKRHGLDYFNYIFWLNFAMGAVCIALFGMSLAWFSTTEIELNHPTWICIGLLVACAMISVVINEILEKWLNIRKNFGDTTHLERLSGRV